MQKHIAFALYERIATGALEPSIAIDVKGHEVYLASDVQKVMREISDRTAGDPFNLIHDLREIVNKSLMVR